jgi:predicted porin
VGGDYAGFSADAYYVKVKSAIAFSALSAAQVTALGPLGFSPSNSLAATISDNTTYSLMAMYSLKPFKFFAAYENITYKNPETPILAGFDVAAYKIAYASNAAYNEEKILSVYWAGAKYSVDSNLDLTAAYYVYHQTSYATGSFTGCTTDANGACRGQLDVVSLDAVYKLSKRFDAFAGAMWSGVKDGSANGYIYSKNNINPTIGVRFTF